MQKSQPYNNQLYYIFEKLFVLKKIWWTEDKQMTMKIIFDFV